MADAMSRVCRFVFVTAAILTLGFLTGASPAFSQSQSNPPNTSDIVVDVRVVGNQSVSLQRIVTHVHTRAGRYFDPQIIEDDVRRLTKSQLFVSVNTSYQRTPEGIIVMFQVVERPTLRYVRYVGASLRRSTLEKQTGIKVGDAVDPYLVEESRRKLEDYYKSKGFSKVRVEVTEGNKPGDRGATFFIHEGPKQRVYEIEFEGNTIADDRRLRTQISSKPPILYLFRGELDESKVDDDVEKLTAYYRGLGFFSAQISREIEFGESGNWATLRFVINEGPRYKVRNVSVVGTRRIPGSDLETELQLKGGKFFDQSSMMRDVSTMTDRYGAIGYVYANVQPDPRFLETPGELDLVYKIEEGARYRVSRVDVLIEGDDPHTRLNTVLNRVDLRPGDIVDTRKIRDSERRLSASGLFQNNPAQGQVPKISFHPADEEEAIMASRPSGPGGYRGQSPDDFDDAPRPLVLTLRAEPPIPPSTPDVGYLPSANADAANEPYVPAETPTIIPLDEFEPPVEPHEVRFQSPYPTSQAGGFGSGDSGSFGQVPLGATAPGSQVMPAGGATTAVGSPPANAYAGGPIGSGELVPVQYAPPAYGGAAPVYTPPPAAPNYGQPYAQAPAAPVYGQPAPSPYMGNAPGVGAPPLPGAPGSLAPGYGSGGELTGQPPPASFPVEEPTYDLVLEPRVAEAQTGRFMLGVGVNSNAGLLGSIILDEQNADLTRLPGSWRDIVDGKAFRGAGQQVRMEAVPGTQVSRYSFIFRQPYLFDTRIQFGGSAYYFQRYYRDWREERLGGRVSLGYQFPYVPDLSVSTAMRMENVELDNPTIPTPAQLSAALGNNALYVWENMIVHDTRDNTFLATEGHRLSFGYDQAFGDFSFPRGTIEGRQHFLLNERPDRSGRQVLTLMSQLGFSGADTPIFENYFAGGFSSMRGFNFRGVGPYVGQVNVGGTFQWLNTVEYMFPISADDMVRGVVFCDFGTVEDDVSVRGKNFRVSPGFGIRLTVPAMGPAPIALDFSVPVMHGPNDDIQNFAFYVGFGR